MRKPFTPTFDHLVVLADEHAALGIDERDGHKYHVAVHDVILLDNGDILVTVYDEDDGESRNLILDGDVWFIHKRSNLVPVTVEEDCRRKTKKTTLERNHPAR
jgi:hypothetical protein